MLIPKIIHQTFSDNSKLQTELLSNINCLKTNNPGWEYRLYEDKDIVSFINKYYGSYVLKRFNQINPLYGAARADLFRYLLMYQCGGVYLDIKSTVRKPIDEVLRPDDQYLLSQWKHTPGELHQRWGLHPDLCHISGGEFQQWHIVARPQHPFLKSVIANVLRNIDIYQPDDQGVGKIGVLRTTGPIAYTLSIAPLLKNGQCRFVDIQKDLSFVYSIYESSGASFHESVFKDHYSTQTGPVIIRSNVARKNNLPTNLGAVISKVFDIFPYWRLSKFKAACRNKRQRRLYEDPSTEQILTKIYEEKS